MELTPYPPIEPTEFNEAEGYIHRAAQFLAMVGKTFVPAQADDSNANLGWNEESQCLESRRFDGHHLQLHLPTFSLDWMFDEHVISYFPVDKTHKKDIYSWLTNQVGTAGYDIKQLRYIEHYDVPTHAVDKGEPFKKPPGDLIDAWITQRSNASIILEEINKIMDQVSEIRIWPHHFDTGTYYPFGETKAIGAGWAIGDDVSPSPYLYIYPWEKDREIDLSYAPKLGLGEWKQNGWTGAIVSSEILAGFTDPTEEVETFLKIVIEHFKTTLAI